MPIQLPQPIAADFAADRTDRASVERCFTEAAIVVDEGKTHIGRDAFGRWKAESTARYRYVGEPFGIEYDGDRPIVTSRVTGDFPGSPVDLRYAFLLAGDSIARLEIAP